MQRDTNSGTAGTEVTQHHGHTHIEYVLTAVFVCNPEYVVYTSAWRSVLTKLKIEECGSTKRGGAAKTFGKRGGTFEVSFLSFHIM